MKTIYKTIQKAIDNKIVNNGFVTKPYEVRVYKF